jgi:hypothetical protein
MESIRNGGTPTAQPSQGSDTSLFEVVRALA